MTRSQSIEVARARYPWLQQMPHERSVDLLAQARTMRLDAQTALFEPGEPCQAFPLVLEGTMRVVVPAGNAREILLYRVVPGELCLISSLAVLTHSTAHARGLADTDLTLLLIPIGECRVLREASRHLQQALFDAVGSRVAEMVQLVAQISASPLEQRVASLLLASSDPFLQATHQQLADDLGTSREIVSRILEGFAARSWVRLGRKRIEMIDRDAIENVATQH
ncbi:MAG: Crp/Fnr family transcriptional regulator [Acidobacteriota bacterium]